MTIHEFDNIILKDGRKAAIVEVYSPIEFEADVDIGTDEWETIPITIHDIAEVTYSSAST
ncbi:hypothetical protein [Lapidilactobacillus luobeiensis]|uniref:hypothetical protein n=1 Tax=Lapidilactobacillus luobeiensis TaxID=2950371 RepID=UPI0021C33BE1|nr:hypothetical protein [Lapidilactobacillus luobeiensis]